MPRLGEPGRRPRARVPGVPACAILAIAALLGLPLAVPAGGPGNIAAAADETPVTDTTPASVGDPAEADVAVSTLHWPPYTAGDLPRGGAVTAVVRAAFAQEDRALAVRVWPWKRAIAKAKAPDNAIVGYFPGYHCRHDPSAAFLRSRPLGASPLGFAEHRDRQHDWETLADLRGMRLGTVVGYANTTAFDRAVSAGRLNVVASSDDASNLRRLLAGRIDYAVVDKYVLAYLKKSDPLLREHADEILFDSRPLERKRLYLCLRDDARGRRLLEVFNRGLERIAPQGMLDRYVERMVKG